MTSAAFNSGYETLTAGDEPAAIACLRIIGPAVADFAGQHIRWRTTSVGKPVPQVGEIRRADFLDADGAPIDDVLVSIHATDPALDIRIHFHGGVWPIRRCREMLVERGFVDLHDRASSPLEERGTAALGCDFSERAPPIWPRASWIEHLAWKLLPYFPTLTGARWMAHQARALPAALRAIRHSASSPGAQAAECLAIANRVRFADWFHKPLRIALVGPPNAGKSTLLNALAGEALSLVSPTPGTTRDWVEAPGEIAGYPVTWIDTAGLRPTADAIEAEGIARTATVVAEADAIVLVVDGTDPASIESISTRLVARTTCVAFNKSDLYAGRPAATIGVDPSIPSIAVSASKKAGLDELMNVVLRGCHRMPADFGAAAFAPAIADGLIRGIEGSDLNDIIDNMLREHVN